MADLSVKIDGIDEFISDVRKAGVNADPLMRAALQNSASRTQTNIRQRAPHRTGALQRSVLTAIKYPSAEVTVNEKYGRYIEEGTKAHTITPVNKKALFWKGALSPYKSVRHPGTRAKPFFKPAVDATQDYIQEQFTKVTERLINIMAGHA